MPIPRSKFFIKTRTPGVFTASESSIQQTCVDLLKLDGWRHLRTDPVSDRRRGKGFGEIGMADDLFLRYTPVTLSGSLAPGSTLNGKLIRGGFINRIIPSASAQVLWVEFKSLNGKPKPEQLRWAAAERASGALVWMATIDFEPTIEGFRKQYAASGLARNIK